MIGAERGRFEAPCLASRHVKASRSANLCVSVDLKRLTINEGKLKEPDQKGVNA